MSEANGIARAFDRFDDFLAVQRDARSHPEEFVAALRRLQESVGIAAAEREIIRGRLAELDVAGNPGALVLGLIVGRMAAELDAETRPGG